MSSSIAPPNNLCIICNSSKLKAVQDATGKWIECQECKRQFRVHMSPIKKKD